MMIFQIIHLLIEARNPPNY